MQDQWTQIMKQIYKMEKITHSLWVQEAEPKEKKRTIFKSDKDHKKYSIE